jgi:hypothetical protein
MIKFSKLREHESQGGIWEITHDKKKKRIHFSFFRLSEISHIAQTVTVGYAHFKDLFKLSNGVQRQMKTVVLSSLSEVGNYESPEGYWEVNHFIIEERVEFLIWNKKGLITSILLTYDEFLILLRFLNEVQPLIKQRNGKAKSKSNTAKDKARYS